LSERHGRHDWYLRMQIDDNKNFKEALTYIAKLQFQEAEKNLRNYGSALMQHLPSETTQFLKRLCTDYKPTNAPLITDTIMDGGDEVII